MSSKLSRPSKNHSSSKHQSLIRGLSHNDDDISPLNKIKRWYENYYSGAVGVDLNEVELKFSGVEYQAGEAH